MQEVSCLLSCFLDLTVFIEAEKLKEAKAATENYRIPLWMNLSGFGLVCYLIFPALCPSRSARRRPAKK
jgi:hypothetical protein